MLKIEIENNMKTIKQIADELGISKDKVKYQVGKLPREMVVKSKEITYLTDKGIQTVTDILVGKTTGELPSKLPGEFPTKNNEPIITLLEKNLNILQEQLKEKDKQLDNKDKQIEELNSRLSETMSILNNSQLLHGGTIQQQLTNNVNSSQVSEQENIEKKPLNPYTDWINCKDFNPDELIPQNDNMKMPDVGIPKIVRWFLKKQQKKKS